jgi:hypothetical protein
MYHRNSQIPRVAKIIVGFGVRSEKFFLHLETGELSYFVSLSRVDELKYLCGMVVISKIHINDCSLFKRFLSISIKSWKFPVFPLAKRKMIEGSRIILKLFFLILILKKKDNK